MKTFTVNQAQDALPQLLEETAASHVPIRIDGSTASAVLGAEEDWRSIEETLYLLSVPGMRESIQAGLRTPDAECSSEPSW